MIPTTERVKAVIGRVEDKYKIKLVGLGENWVQALLLEWEKMKVEK